MQFIPVSQELMIDGSAKSIENDYLFHATKLYKRETAPSTFNRVVTFDSSTWNYREGLNLASGIFTVPSKGSYLFQADVLKGMYLQVNGVKITWSEEGDIYLSIPSFSQNIARVTLNAGDRVTLFNYQSYNPVENYFFYINLKGFRINQNN